MNDRALVAYAMTVGLLDAATGALLVAAPELTLRLMFVDQAPLDPVWLRFIGAFVGGIGMTYVYPLLATPARRAALLRGALELTVIPRMSVGLFVAGAVALGAMVPAWSTVAATDLGLAVVQVTWLLRARRTRAAA